MKSCRSSVLLLIALSVAPAVAQQRVFVSAQHGDDINICSAAAPCRSFAHAITVVASGGEILVLDSGGYGPVTITQSVSIVSPLGVEGSITQSAIGESAIFINAASATVVLRGLSLFGSGTGYSGIVVQAAHSVFIQACSVTGFSNNGIHVSVAGVSKTSLTNTWIASNGSSGALFTGTENDEALFEINHCRFEDNFAIGLNVFEGGRGSVRDSIFDGGQYGLSVQTGQTGKTALLAIENCSVVNAGIGIAATSNTFAGVETVRVSNTLIAHNTTGVFSYDATAHIVSRSNNTLVDNGSPGTFTGFFTAQ